VEGIRLDGIGTDPLAKVQLNQLLAFGHEAPVSDDFFRYYWLSAPKLHPYDVKLVPVSMNDGCHQTR
jgi:hypothetical protein